MRKLLKLQVCLFVIAVACQPSETRQSQSLDSLSVVEQNYDVLKVPRSFAIGNGLEGGTIELLGRKTLFTDFLPSLYVPDTIADEKSGSPDFIITSVQTLQDNFFTESGNCEQRSLVICTRGDFVEGEAYDLFFIALGRDNRIVVAGKQTFEGSRGQASTELKVSPIDLPVNEKCSLLLVSSQTESGQNDLYRERWAEIFIASGKGFRPLFKLQLEETFIQDYEAARDGDDLQDTSSKIQDLEVLPSSTNNLHDIRVSYELRENGVITREGNETYRFDGQYYSLAE